MSRAAQHAQGECRSDDSRGTPPRPGVVLIVEDLRSVRALTAEKLRRDGFEVVEAADGQAALDLIANPAIEIDVAIIDLGLPLVNGLDVVAAIKQSRGALTSVLVVSGTIDREVKIKAFDLGADDYVCKPVHMPELLRRVAAFHRSQQSHREAERSRERMEQLNVYASEAAALLAHDLSNGLSIALGNLDFLRETAPPDDDDDRSEACLSTLRALRRMAGLVRNFVELRQLEDAALIPKPELIDVAELVHGVAALHRHEVQPRGARIYVDCPTQLDALVDPALVERAVHNLVGNAIRYVDHGGRIRVSASTERTAEGRELVLQIGNTGSAIPASMAPSLFEKYRTGGDHSSQRGMGLYFCRLASEAQGGRIGIESTADYPANFVVRLPIQPELPAADKSSCPTPRQLEQFGHTTLVGF
ncbi:MAG TPA: response regulator [Kofleriaceae bacterium]|nr:response regulator [Kofleriaceae bacterium]